MVREFYSLLFIFHFLFTKRKVILKKRYFILCLSFSFKNFIKFSSIFIPVDYQQYFGLTNEQVCVKGNIYLFLIESTLDLLRILLNLFKNKNEEHFWNELISQKSCFHLPIGEIIKSYFIKAKLINVSYWVSI